MSSYCLLMLRIRRFLTRRAIEERRFSQSVTASDFGGAVISAAL